MTYETNPAIARKDKENDDDAIYSEWFHENLDENISAYSMVEGHSKDSSFEIFERLHDLYDNSYDKDEEFEYWCEYEFDQQMLEDLR